MAELVKGLGEPVKDLIEDLNTKGGKNQGHEWVLLCTRGLSRGKGEAGRGGPQRAELWFTTCVPGNARRLTGIPWNGGPEANESRKSIYTTSSLLLEIESAS